MNLIPWRRKKKEDHGGGLSSADRFAELRHEVDDLFERCVPGLWDPSAWSTTSLARWTPSIDIEETDSEITVRAELPGVDPKDVEVTIAGNLLTISGEKKSVKEDRGRSHFYAERRYGKFSRTIRLPGEVDASKVKAEDAHGVLTIRLRRVAHAKPKRVPVTAA